MEEVVEFETWEELLQALKEMLSEHADADTDTEEVFELK